MMLPSSVEPEKVVDVELLGHVGRHLEVGLHLIDELVLGLSRVPLANVQGQFQGLLDAVLVHGDVVVSEQLFSSFHILNKSFRVNYGFHKTEDLSVKTGES